jgi:hypothetical protein
MPEPADDRIEAIQNNRRRQRYYRNRRTVQKIDDGPTIVPLGRMSDVDLLLEAWRAVLSVWGILRDGTSVEGMREIRVAHDCLCEYIERGQQLELKLDV